MENVRNRIICYSTVWLSFCTRERSLQQRGTYIGTCSAGRTETGTPTTTRSPGTPRRYVRAGRGVGRAWIILVALAGSRASCQMRAESRHSAGKSCRALEPGDAADAYTQHHGATVLLLLGSESWYGCVAAGRVFQAWQASRLCRECFLATHVTYQSIF